MQATGEKYGPLFASMTHPLPIPTMRGIPHKRKSTARRMTDLEIIKKFGGTVSLAHALDLDPRRVSDWKKRGISAAGRYQIRDLAKRRRVALPADFLTRKPTSEKD